MENSCISTRSSTTDYSGIGFERTMSLHFEDLKRDQSYVTSKVMEVTKGYRAIMIREAKWEARKKSLADEAAKQGLMLSDIWSYSEEDTGEEMAIDVAKMEFCQDRQEAFRLVKAWAQDSANQIAIYPGFDVEKRRKGAMDFINLMKKYLKSTKPLGSEEEEEEEDQRWLEEKLKKLPDAKLDVGPVKERLRSSRTKEKSRVESPSVMAKEFRTSTPEVVRDDKGKKKEDERAPCSNLGTMMEDRGASISDKIRVMRAQEASSKGKPSDADGGADEDGDAVGDAASSETSDDKCPVLSPTLNPSHICVVLQKSGTKVENKGDKGEAKGGVNEEGEEEEQEGPSYIVVKKTDTRSKMPKEEKGIVSEDGSFHRSIIEKKLKRPISEGLVDTSIYQRYESKLEKWQKRKPLRMKR